MLCVTDCARITWDMDVEVTTFWVTWPTCVSVAEGTRLRDLCDLQEREVLMVVTGDRAYHQTSDIDADMVTPPDTELFLEAGAPAAISDPRAPRADRALPRREPRM